MSNRAFRPAPPSPRRTPPPPNFAAPGKKTSSRSDAIEAAPPYRLCSGRRGIMLVNENDVYMGRAYLKYGECCEAELTTLLALIRIPGLVVEVGTNMGIFTVPLAAQLAQEGREMLAFEPQPVIFQQLCANLALNGLLNVSALPYACGSTGGMVSFELPDYRNTNNFGGLSMGAREGTPGKVETVPCVRLDDLVPEAAVAFIKVDVEGQELAVLQGSAGILTRSRPVLYVENDRVENSPELIEWLWAQGYELWWHIPPLFNPNNFHGVAENIYGNIHSYNMLCLPEADTHTLHGMMKITDAQAHPLKG